MGPGVWPPADCVDKPNTDDMREALWGDGATVAAYNPKAEEEAARLYPEALANGRLLLAATKGETAEAANALAICTEWKRYRWAGLLLDGVELRSAGYRPAPEADR